MRTHAQKEVAYRFRGVIRKDDDFYRPARVIARVQARDFAPSISLDISGAE